MTEQSTKRSLQIGKYCATCNLQIPTAVITDPQNNSTKNNYGKPDRSLESWDKVVKDRKKVSKMLTKITKRTTADLVMNTVDKVRELKEKKSVLEYSQIKAKPSLRDALWEQPLRLMQKCCCEPVYEQQRTKIEMGKIPEIEYVAVPEYIQKEKGISGPYTRISCKDVGFENSKYKSQREIELAQEILQVEPHRPSIKNLMVKGNKPKPPPTKKLILPVISISECEPSCKQSDSVHAVRINNTVFFKDVPHLNIDFLRFLRKESWHEEKTDWTYYFNVPVSRISINKFTLTNLGTVVVRYCWQAMKPKCSKLSDPIDNQVFFFNKNEDVVAPGQTREIVFLFISPDVGMFEEKWNFDICGVTFFDSKFKLTVSLIADAVESDLDFKEDEIQKLTNFINSQEREYVVLSILEEIISKSMIVSPLPCPYNEFTMEENMFVMKNSDCYYHQTEVEKLKKMYSDTVDAKPWDLSIRTLRMAIMKLAFEERMEKYEMLKKSHNILLRPWEEGLKISQQKHVAMKQQLGQFVDLFYVENLRLGQEFCRTEILSSFGAKEVTIATKLGEQTHRELFRMTMKAHLAETIEIGSALLSSLDLFRWIDFEW